MSEKERDHLLFLEDILNAIEKIEIYTKELSFPIILYILSKMEILHHELKEGIIWHRFKLIPKC